MPAIDPNTFALLRLTLVNGLGPVLIGRLIQAFGSALSALEAPVGALRNIKGIGSERAARIRGDIERSDALAQHEFDDAERLGATIVGIHDAAYPPLLRQIPDPPPVLYVRGTLRPDGADRYPIGIVGSRSCTLYGREQAERFAQHLGQCGLTIVSGGARGIDTSAHRAALRVQGRTIVVMGCGLSHVYPPENAELFDQIAGRRGGGGGEGRDAEAAKGAIVSELPMQSAPTRENFPARNRIISGISLGVIVIEAGRRSGALITARQAVEEHGREVFALPGRVDSPASEGVLDLLKQGGAAMVTHPQDVLDSLESPARHHFAGTHDAVTRDPARDDQGVFDWQTLAPAPASDAARDQADHGPGTPRVTTSLSSRQGAILEALAEPRTIDELVQLIGGDAASLRADITVLEIRRRVARSGSRLVRSDSSKT
jgi:DNA processing protein